MKTRASVSWQSASQWTICPKNSRKLPKFLRISWKESKVIWSTNIGLRIKWKYSYIGIYHMSAKNTFKVARLDFLGATPLKFEN